MPSPTQYSTLKPEMSTRRFKIFMKQKKTIFGELAEQQKKLPGVG